VAGGGPWQHGWPEHRPQRGHGQP